MAGSKTRARSPKQIVARKKAVKALEKRCGSKHGKLTKKVGGKRHLKTATEIGKMKCRKSASKTRKSGSKSKTRKSKTRKSKTRKSGSKRKCTRALSKKAKAPFRCRSVKRLKKYLKSKCPGESRTGSKRALVGRVRRCHKSRRASKK